MTGRLLSAVKRRAVAGRRVLDARHRLQEEGYDQSVMLNAKKESDKLKDLSILKGKIPPGPFSSVKEVHDFMLLPMDEKERNNRLYTEVRFA